MKEMTSKEVAKQLNVSQSRVTQLVNEGKLVPINKRKRGKRFFARFDSVEIELFMAKRNGTTKDLTPLPKMPKIKNEQPTIQQQLRAIQDVVNKILAKL